MLDFSLSRTHKRVLGAIVEGAGAGRPPGRSAVLRVRGPGELEAEVMDRMWSAARPMTVREVLTEVNTTKNLAYTTVMTVMNNLHKKEWLRREMVARAWVYSPVATLEQCSARLMEPP